MSDEEYFEFCAQNRKMPIEREASGAILITPLGGAETSHRNLVLTGQLYLWAERDGRGRSFSSEFFLPDGAALAPYAAWLADSRLDQFTKGQKKRFLYLCPDFVVELTSPVDRLNKVQGKMQQWIENGAALGWLIDADQRTVYVYRPGKDPERLVDVDHVDGEGPVEGFRLELSDIWQGL